MTRSAILAYTRATSRDSSMIQGPHLRMALLGLFLLGPVLRAQVTVTGRIVDDTGAAIAGTRVELRPVDGGTPAVASSDPAGNFTINLPAAGEYSIRAERLGFYLYQRKSQSFDS